MSFQKLTLITNPFEEALPVILDMVEKMQGADLSKEFPFKPSDFGIDEQSPTGQKILFFRFTW